MNLYIFEQKCSVSYSRHKSDAFNKAFSPIFRFGILVGKRENICLINLNKDLGQELRMKEKHINPKKYPLPNRYLKTTFLI